MNQNEGAEKLQKLNVPIVCNDTRDVSRINEKDRALGYKAEPASENQVVTRGRILVRPDIDLNDYRCRAVFDWIEFEVTLPKPSQ